MSQGELLHAYYAGAVPADLLRSEQDRLAAETRQAERHLEAAEASFGDIASTLAKALDLLADCQRAYLAAPGHLRRQWNQALFERLVIYDERIADAEVPSPSPRSPIRSFRSGWVARPSPKPALLLAAVQMRSF